MSVLEATEGISFMYNKKRRGPRIDPCGTPDVTGSQLEKLPSILDAVYDQIGMLATSSVVGY